MEKIDVCVVTRDNKLPEGLEYIPVNNLIIENIKPVGLARQECIFKVTTSIFAFIDDDIIIDKYWFNTLYQFIKDENVGAVWGITTNKGYGWFSKYTFDVITLKELERGERFNTSNCLIKTELVKRWIPSYGLNCYEDLDMGNFIMRQDKKILFVPSTAIHYKGWKETKRSAEWAGYRFKEAYKSTKKEYIKRIISPFKALILRGLPSAIYISYRNFYFIIGMVKRELKR
jgi:GT2 family glycosyltransferase